MRKLTRLLKTEMKLFKNCWAKTKENKTSQADIYFIESIEHRKMKNFRSKGVYR